MPYLRKTVSLFQRIKSKKQQQMTETSKSAVRHEILLLVLLSCSLRSLGKYFFNTRREISYLRAAM